MQRSGISIDKLAARLRIPGTDARELLTPSGEGLSHENAHRVAQALGMRFQPLVHPAPVENLLSISEKIAKGGEEADSAKEDFIASFYGTFSGPEHFKGSESRHSAKR